MDFLIFWNSRVNTVPPSPPPQHRAVGEETKCLPSASRCRGLRSCEAINDLPGSVQLCPRMKTTQSRLTTMSSGSEGMTKRWPSFGCQCLSGGRERTPTQCGLRYSLSHSLMAKDVSELKVRHLPEGCGQREPPKIALESPVTNGGGSLVLAWH